MEEWKDVAAAPLYQVSSQGRIRRGGKTLNPFTNPNGYCTINLYNGAIPLAKQLHRLVAEAFIPNPESLPVVNHKGPKTDNSAANLEWATYQENRVRQIAPNREPTGREIVQLKLDGVLVQEWKSAAQAARALKTPSSNIVSCCRGVTKTAKGFLWKYKDDCLELPNEEWREVAVGSETYQVSSSGRIEVKGGKKTFGSKKGNYMYAKGQLVHRLVAAAFLQKPDGKDYVNHIDGDGSNNRVDNLEWVTQKENMRHAFRAGSGSKVMRQVRQIGPDGRSTVHHSVTEAGRTTGTNHSHISDVCAGKRNTAGGYRWEYVEKREEKGDLNEMAAFLDSVLGEVLSEKEAAPIPELPDSDPLWAELGL